MRSIAIGDWILTRTQIKYIGRPYLKSCPYAWDFSKERYRGKEWLDHLKTKTWFVGKTKNDFYTVLEIVTQRLKANAAIIAGARRG